jgi:hypothetical protein
VTSSPEESVVSGSVDTTELPAATTTPPSPSADPCPGGRNRGTGASAFEGNWQRHESQLDLEREHGTSTLAIGASAVDTENWRVDWTQDECDSGEIVVTLLDRTAIYGSGVGGDLYEGKTFTARLGLGAGYVTVLNTNGLGDAPGQYTWCRSGESVPECGA